MARRRSFDRIPAVSSSDPTYGGDIWLQELAARPGLLRPGQVAKLIGVSPNRLDDLDLPWFELPGGSATPREKSRRRRLAPRVLADKLWGWRAADAAA